MHRNGSLFAVVAVALVATCLAGCPGRLEQPERFGPGGARDGGADPTGDGGGTGEIDVRAMLVTSCGGSGCHGSASPALGLDLESDGIEARLVGVSAVGCPTRVLVDASDPSASFLLEKVTDATPECGGRMPLLRDQLTTEEQDALRAWIEGL